jgi:hypothetical protein
MNNSSVEVFNIYEIIFANASVESRILSWTKGKVNGNKVLNKVTLLEKFNKLLRTSK